MPLLLMVFTALLLAPLPVLAQETITGAVVRGDNVILRSAPDTNADQLDTLQLGDALYITGDAETEAGDRKPITVATLGVTRVWFVPVVVVETGQGGWIAELYINPRSLRQVPRPARLSPAAGTRESPIPLGQRVTVGGWGVVVRGVRIASYDEMLEENMFNDPPIEGKSFVLVEVSVSNKTETEDSVFSALDFGVLGPSNVVDTGHDFDTSCGVVPNELDEFAEVFPGGTIRGNLCYQIDLRELDETLFFAEDWDISNSQRVWFALA
jgi:hypothetical protein